MAHLRTLSQHSHHTILYYFKHQNRKYNSTNSTKWYTQGIIIIWMFKLCNECSRQWQQNCQKSLKRPCWGQSMTSSVSQQSNIIDWQNRRLACCWTKRCTIHWAPDSRLITLGMLEAFHLVTVLYMYTLSLCLVWASMGWICQAVVYV